MDIQSTTENAERTEISTEDLNNKSGKIIDCAVQVHKKLGPGLLESAYQHGLAYMFSKNDIAFEKEKPVRIYIDDYPIDAGYRADFICHNKIILEIKSVQKLLPVHVAQLLTYMKLGGFPLGLLLNFNEQLMKNGIKRMRL
jgi:GxxExxY protein